MDELNESLSLIRTLCNTTSYFGILWNFSRPLKRTTGLIYNIRQPDQNMTPVMATDLVKMQLGHTIEPHANTHFL